MKINYLPNYNNRKWYIKRPGIGAKPLVFAAMCSKPHGERKAAREIINHHHTTKTLSTSQVYST